MMAQGPQPELLTNLVDSLLCTFFFQFYFGDLNICPSCTNMFSLIQALGFLRQVALPGFVVL